MTASAVRCERAAGRVGRTEVAPMEATTEREFLDYREEWTSYYLAMLAAREYKKTRAYKLLRAEGWRIVAYRYSYGWALYRERRTEAHLTLSAPLEPGMVGLCTTQTAKGIEMDPILTAHVADSIERITDWDDRDANADLAASLLAASSYLLAATRRYVEANGSVPEADFDSNVQVTLAAYCHDHAIALPEPASALAPLDAWVIFASSGEYEERAASAADAVRLFEAKHEDDFVHAVVNAEMRPRYDGVTEADEEPHMSLLLVTEAANVEADAATVTPIRTHITLAFAKSGAKSWTSTNNAYVIRHEGPRLYTVRAYGQLLREPATSYEAAESAAQSHFEGAR